MLAPVSENIAPSTPRLASPVALASPSTSASTNWSANTIRAIRAKNNRREIVIPKGAQLRVIGRTRTDVMVSYEGSTVTIPISATDLK